MSVSSINSITNNQKLAFKGDEQNQSVIAAPINSGIDIFDKNDKFKEFREYTYRIKDTSVKKIEDMKKPLDVVLQVAGMSMLAYLSVQCVTAGTLARIAPKLGLSFENALRKPANSLRNKANELKSVKAEGIFNKIKNITGNVIDKVETGARTLYKGIAYRGLYDSMTGAEKANNALGNILGTSAFGYTLYNLCTKDEDNDGIKDVFQKKHSLLSAIMPSEK